MRVRNGMAGSLLAGGLCACLPAAQDRGAPPPEHLPATVVFTPPAGSTARALLLADLDGAGKRDVVAVFEESAGTRVVTLRGTSSGGFADAETCWFADSVPRAVALLRGDPVEVAVFGIDEARNLATLTVVHLPTKCPRHGRELPLDAPLSTLAGAVNTPPAALAATDVNGDGVEDLMLAVVHQDRRMVVHTLLRLGDGTFHDQEQPVSPPRGFTQATFADVDGDTRLDLVGADLGIGNDIVHRTRVYLAGADGTFRTGPVLAWGTDVYFASHLLAGDFDQDGDTDIRLLLDMGYDVYHRNRGDGTFDAPAVFKIQIQDTFQEALGIRADGRAELIISSDTNLVVRLTLDALGQVQREEMMFLPGYHLYSFYLPAFPAMRVASEDINRDGVLDYFFADKNGVVVSLSAGATP
jgi:hypothetical protein